MERGKNGVFLPLFLPYHYRLKNMKLGYWLIAGIWISAMALSSCSEETLMNSDEPSEETKVPEESPMPLTVSVRIGEAVLKDTWTANDRLSITPLNVSDMTSVFALESGIDNATGIFTGLPATSAEADSFAVYYPNNIKDDDSFLTFSYVGQVQAGNDNKAHLAQYFTLRKTVNSLQNEIYLGGDGFSQSSCMKFELDNLPVMIPTHITLNMIDRHGFRVGGSFFQTNILSETSVSSLQSHSADCLDLALDSFAATTSVRAYMMMSNATVTVPDGSALRVTVTDGEHIYYADKIAIGGDLVFASGKCHCISLDTWVEDTAYVSMDYTIDRQPVPLTTNQRPDAPIDVVILGDGYTDREMDTYARIMQETYEDLFTVEPFKSFQSYFNVKSIYAVSENSMSIEGELYNGAYGTGSRTRFSTCFTPGSTTISGNDELAKDYAITALSNPSDHRLENTLIIVMINADCHAGTCCQNRPSDPLEWIQKGYDYGVGTSVVYIPARKDRELRRQLIHHEACGHGFAKLSDEYENAKLSTELNIAWYALAAYHQIGWNKNVDKYIDGNETTLSEVDWSEFAKDYADEGIGVYAGAYALNSGFCRPTENSIMRYNTGGFNPPSRRAIYYRIRKLIDPSAINSYNEFVEWDKTNRMEIKERSVNDAEKSKNQMMLPSPIIKYGHWKQGKFIMEMSD